MTTKAARTNLREAAATVISDDAVHQPDIDDFIARNRDALNESIGDAIAELDQGVVSRRTIADIITDAHGRRGRPE